MKKEFSDKPFSISAFVHKDGRITKNPPTKIDKSYKRVKKKLDKDGFHWFAVKR